jgi:hypothetical protein
MNRPEDSKKREILADLGPVTSKSSDDFGA